MLLLTLVSASIVSFVRAKLVNSFLAPGSYNHNCAILLIPYNAYLL